MQRLRLLVSAVCRSATNEPRFNKAERRSDCRNASFFVSTVDRQPSTVVRLFKGLKDLKDLRDIKVLKDLKDLKDLRALKAPIALITPPAKKEKSGLWIEKIILHLSIDCGIRIF